MTTYGVVIEVAVTGMKKTVTVRSPLQVRLGRAVPTEAGFNFLLHAV